MKPKAFMMIAGEASGDLLAAELVAALRIEIAGAEFAPSNDLQPLHTSLEPKFFGAGGSRMAAAGVNLAFDLTRHSVIGLSDVVKHYFKFRRLFVRLYKLALEQQPEAIICVDFAGFNRRFAQAVKQYVRRHLDWFHNWNPKIIQFVSPQVWASRERRAYQMARDYDLVVSIFPFEKDWYAQRVPQLRVEFVGHPMIDRYAGLAGPLSTPQDRAEQALAQPSARGAAKDGGRPGGTSPTVVLLPGSRPAELVRHLPVMLGALQKLQAAMPGLRGRMVLPNEDLMHQARAGELPEGLAVQIGGLPGVLAQADLAIASTGTVTMECAYFGVPTVALYKTSWSTYQIGKRLVRVRHLAMPNLLAGEEVYPEFVQHTATAEKIAAAALSLLQDPARRLEIKQRLARITALLCGPGATRRAARAILSLV